MLTVYLLWCLQQSNLSNPPTPPASLPPTPPPVNRQKMINGFATTEELASKAAAMGKHSWWCTSMSHFSLTLPLTLIRKWVQVNYRNSIWSIFMVTCRHSMYIHIDIVLLFSTVSKGLVPKPLHVPFRTEEDLLARAIAQGPKTVDVPASLPTPPHNNQEELR